MSIKILFRSRCAMMPNPKPADFNITWTPTMVVLDETGKEHHRNVGFQSPEEFIPFLDGGPGQNPF